MGFSEIALGLANTLDCELVWNSALLDALMQVHSVSAADVQNWSRITSIQKLLGSVAYHLSRGTGCGVFVQRAGLLDSFLKSWQYQLTLGGTGVRAALALSQMRIPSLVHLLSYNEETLQLLPKEISWVCSQSKMSRCPHVVLQYPKGATFRVGTLCLTAPQANRLIYTDDMDCASLHLAPEFFSQAKNARIIVLSSFDLIQSQVLLEERVRQIAAWLSSYGKGKIIFYEDACFAHSSFPAIVRQHLLPYIDIYSMNEDEFQSYVGHSVNLLNAWEVTDALSKLRTIFCGPALVVHTKHWALVNVSRAKRLASMLSGGNTMAGTRFRYGDDISPARYAETQRIPKQQAAENFAQSLASIMKEDVYCLPAYALPEEKVTTIGLGDSFVGGAVYALHKDLLCSNTGIESENSLVQDFGW